MDLYEAMAHYGLTKYEIQSAVEDGTLCERCYWEMGTCEHTKEDEPDERRDDTGGTDRTEEGD